MPAVDQFRRMLFELADQRRQNAIQEREGTVYQVWSQNGETKYRVQLGTGADGQPWLTPWLHSEDHRGSHREEQKYTKGMNVKVSTVSGDFRQAKITHSAENQNHPRPDHADDYHRTKQYDTWRERTGPDFKEHWIAQQSTTPGGTGTTALGSGNAAVQLRGKRSLLNRIFGEKLGTGLGSTGGLLTDPDSQSVVLVRSGQKPTAQTQNGPWDGPPTDGGNPQKRHLTWAGTPGNTPQINNDVIHTQFNDKTKNTMNDGQIQDQIGKQGDANQTTKTMTLGTIVHSVGQTASSAKSSITQRVSQIVHQLQQGGQSATLAMQPGSFTHQLNDGGGNVSTIQQSASSLLLQVKGAGGTSSINMTAGAISMSTNNLQMNSTTVPDTPTLPQPPDPPVASTGAVFVGYITGDILTVLQLISGYIGPGLALSGADAGAAIMDGTTVTAINEDGTFTVSPAQNIGGAQLTGSGNGDGTITVETVTGTIQLQDILCGNGAPNDTVIELQQSGSIGGPGVYECSELVTGFNNAWSTGIMINAGTSSVTSSQLGGANVNGSIDVAGVTRSYLLHVPKGYQGNDSHPLVMVFHGGGGTGPHMATTTGFSLVADQNDFFVVYPNGINGQWQDGDGKTNLDIDDVGFVEALIAYLKTQYPINADMIYATGHSEGAHFSGYLAMQMPGVLAAIAPVAGPIFTALAADFPLTTPIAVCGIQGTADTHDPYDGGIGSDSVKSNEVLSTPETMQLWAQTNGCNLQPSITDFPPVANDGTSVALYQHTGTTPVDFYVVNGMGHQWPPNDNPAMGPTTQNLNASETIWQFFAGITLGA